MAQSSKGSLTLTNAAGSAAAYAPQWALDPFKDFVKHLHSSINLLDLTKGAISAACFMPEIAEGHFRSTDNELSPENQKIIEELKRGGGLARSEVASGFPFLHAQTVIALWSSLETLINDYVMRSLIRRPELLTLKPWKDLKVRIGEYESLDQEQKARHLADIYKLGKPSLRDRSFRIHDRSGWIGRKC